jgi:3-methyladenine DNA glycosylase/8-oxoguanine DNA glycosylase
MEHIKVNNFSLFDTITCGQFFLYTELDGETLLVKSAGNSCKMRQEGDTVFIDCPPNKLEFWKNFLDIDTDTDYDRALQFCTKSTHEVLKQAADFCGGIHIIRQDPWDALLCFIISQNNNIPRIKGIVGKLCETYGGYLPTPKQLAKLNERDLAYLHAGYRARYLIEAGKFWGTLPWENGTTLDREQLMSICGVGPKVADCVLLYGFHKIDAYPKDVWIKRVIAEYFPDGFPETEFSGIVQQYLFHYIRHITRKKL